MTNPPITAAAEPPSRWCPPEQPQGRYRAVLRTLDPLYSRIRSERRARFATPALARRWLEYHAGQAEARQSSEPVHATVEYASATAPLTWIYDACGSAGEVTQALELRGRVRGENSPVTTVPAADTTITASLLTAYEQCLDQLRATDTPALHRYRAGLRRDLGAVLTTGMVPAALIAHAHARLRGADLRHLTHPDGAFLATIHTTATTTAPTGQAPRTHTRRYTSARHAREYLVHTLSTDFAARPPGADAALHVTVTNTGTEPAAIVYSVSGSAQRCAATLSAVTDFDGTYLLGIPELDRHLLTALLLDYHHSAQELCHYLDTAHADTDTFDRIQARLHAHHQRYREISAMLDDPGLTDLAEHARAEMDAADEVFELDTADGVERPLEPDGSRS